MVSELSNYLMDSDDLEQNAAVLAMARAVKRGDLSAALLQLRSWIASLPYDIAIDGHLVFPQLAFSLMFVLIGKTSGDVA